MEETETMHSDVQEMQALLVRVVSDKETSGDSERYEDLRYSLIASVEPEEIPDFLFACNSVADFKTFANALSITERGRIVFIEKNFAAITIKEKEEHKNAPLIRMATNTLEETRHIGRVAKGEDDSIVTNKLVKYSWQLISIVAVFATLYSFYLQVKSNDPHITVNNAVVSHLTIPPRVAGLKATYSYRDSVVSDLWKLEATVNNIGTETIVAIGAKKNITKSNGLYLSVLNGFKILNTSQIASSLPANVSVENDTTLFLGFEQWRKAESVQIGLYLEKKGDRTSKMPMLSLNERQIVDGKVDNIPYRLLKPTYEPLLINSLPLAIKNPLKWLLITVFGILGIIGMPVAAFSELRTPKGKNGKFKTLLPFVVGAIFCLAPLLWMIPKFW